MQAITGIVGKMSGKVCRNVCERVQIGFLNFIQNVKKFIYSPFTLLESLLSISLIFKQNNLQVLLTASVIKK